MLNLAKKRLNLQKKFQRFTIEKKPKPYKKKTFQRFSIQKNAETLQKKVRRFFYTKSAETL
jgi:hypothetical protein